MSFSSEARCRQDMDGEGDDSLRKRRRLVDRVTEGRLPVRSAPLLLQGGDPSVRDGRLLELPVDGEDERRGHQG
eukprot:5504340-Pyramimonas_sp.AAC.1